MKMTQTWGWLAAGVLAAGLNASYHDGGLQWAHRIADRVENASSMVRDLATGHADLFLTEAKLVLTQPVTEPAVTEPAVTQNEPQDATSLCRWATMLDRVQSRIDRSERRFVHVEAMTARQRAALDRAEAQRQRMEDLMEAHRARLEVKMAELRVPANFDPVVFNVPQPPACPRVRVRVPRMPNIKIPAPAIHIDVPGADPI